MVKMYIKPNIKQMLENINSVKTVTLGDTNYFVISRTTRVYLINLIPRFAAIDKVYSTLTDSEKLKYSSYMNNAERLLKYSILEEEL